MNRYQVEFLLNSGEKIQTIMGNNKQSELSQNIKYRLSTLKYWELQLEEGRIVLITDEVASFRVSQPLEKDGSSVESKNYTFAALIFRDIDEQKAVRGYTIVFPDLELISGGSTLLETYNDGKTLLKSHLEMEIEEQSSEIIHNAYFYHPSTSQEEALERHYTNLPDAFDDKELREYVIFHKYTEITVTVEIDHDYEKYFLRELST